MAGERPSRASLREVKREYRKRRHRRLFGRFRRRRLCVVKAPRRRARVLGRTLVGTAAILAIVAAGVFVNGGLPERPRKAAAPVPVLVPTTPPPPSTPPPARNPFDPFRGSAVARWPVGTAGLAVPQAAAVGSYTPALVKAAYDATARYLRAGMLDERVLYGGDLRPVLATIDPGSAKRRGAAQIANVFRDDVVKAHPDTRVNGFLTARAVGTRLHVEFRYVVVYALRSARGGTAELVVIRRTGTMLFDREGRGLSRGWLYRSGYTSGHSRCGVSWPESSVEVWLGPATATPVESPVPEPTRTFNVLDPREDAPVGCFQNTGKP